MEKVSTVVSKTGIATGDVAVEITLNRQNFAEIPNIILYRDRRMLVVVEGRKPYCGMQEHMAKACPGKKLTLRPTRVAATTSTEPSKVPGDWKEVVTKGRKQKAGPSSPQKDDPLKQQQQHPTKKKSVEQSKELQQ